MNNIAIIQTVIITLISISISIHIFFHVSLLYTLVDLKILITREGNICE